MSHLYSSKVLQPSKQSLDLPASAITAQRSTVLGAGFLSVDLMRSYHLNTLLAQPFIQRITVIGSISDQSFRSHLRKPGFEGRLNQLHFMRRSTSNGYGDRKTSAVCHCHELCTLAPLGFPHPAAPFFAMTKLPSKVVCSVTMKYSVRSNLPRSVTCCTSARNTFSNVPQRIHSWKRRWQVWYGGYLSGMSCHGAPVRKTHKMPFRISRSFTRGLPRPSFLLFGLGRCGLTTSHCSSLRSIGSLPISSSSPVSHF
jgi:hypothetical protein